MYIGPSGQIVLIVYSEMLADAKALPTHAATGCHTGRSAVPRLSRRRMDAN